MDEISLNEAEDAICFYTKDAFDSSPLVSLFWLRYTEDENTIEWEKRKVEYTPATFLPTTFQDLLKMCIYLWISNKILSKRMDYLQDIAVQKISNRAHEQIGKNSRRMKYQSMEQRMTFAFMQKMRLIRRN